MALTNFPGGITSMGVPVLGAPGIFSTGKVFFVKPASGADGNDGLSLDYPLDTVEAALAKCVSGRGDVIYLISDGATTGSSRDTATIAWSKDNTHLVGVCAPTFVSQRARISPTASFTPLMTVSGNGCIFANVQFFHGYNTAEAQICVNVTGQRNYFYNCHFAGMGHATAGDDAGSASLALTAGSENMFKGCTFGLDTVARSTTNAEIDLKTAATRNYFEDCLILSFADNAGHLFVKADTAADIDRFAWFKRCLFMNATNSTATNMTAAISAHASAGGHVIVDDCGLIGATHWVGADTAVVRVLGPVPNGQTTGISVSADLP